MKAAAIIAEYNPFHNGHQYQIQKVRELTGADLIFVIMSGDFVQRGAPACINKYIRCQMALNAGVDIILELPVYGALGSAEVFASSAVALLDQLTCIDYLCFGCEDADLKLLEQIARVLADEPEEYQHYLREALREGCNFPAARSKALERYMAAPECSAVISKPNNILAIEYIKAIHKNNSAIQPIPIARIGADYHDIQAYPLFSSATAIRKILESAGSMLPETLAVPESTRVLIHEYLSSGCVLTRNDFSEMLALRLLDPHINLTSYMDITEDLANRIDACRHQFKNTDQFIELLRTRNMTSVRIARCLFHILLDHRKDVFEEWKAADYSGYCRLLGFHEKASCFWKAVPSEVRSTIVTSPGRSCSLFKGHALQLFQADMYASSLYRQILQCRSERELPNIYSEPLIVIK